jgi:thymidylate kinase
MVRLAVSGSFSVGKTSVVQGVLAQMKEQCPALRAVLIGNVSRDLAGQGRVLADKESSPEHYCLYVAEYIKRLMAAKGDLIIHDRTVLDTLCYVVANDNASPEFVEMLEQIVHLYICDIDLYLYIPIEIPVHEDGVRVVDAVYRTRIDLLLRLYFEKYAVDYQMLSGSLDKRIARAANLLRPFL